VQLISDPAGARSSVHRCTHTIHTTPQAAPSACTLMFNHMRCRPSGAAAPRPSSVLPSVPPDPRRAPGLQPSPGTTGARGIGAGCPPGRRPGRMQSPRACWPSLRPCARVHVLSKLTYGIFARAFGACGLARCSRPLPALTLPAQAFTRRMLATGTHRARTHTHTA
jgi:hypothetical protein